MKLEKHEIFFFFILLRETNSRHKINIHRCKINTYVFFFLCSLSITSYSTNLLPKEMGLD